MSAIYHLQLCWTCNTVTHTSALFPLRMTPHQTHQTTFTADRSTIKTHLIGFRAPLLNHRAGRLRVTRRGLTAQGVPRNYLGSRKRPEGGLDLSRCQTSAAATTTGGADGEDRGYGKFCSAVVKMLTSHFLYLDSAGGAASGLLRSVAHVLLFYILLFISLVPPWQDAFFLFS